MLKNLSVEKVHNLSAASARGEAVDCINDELEIWALFLCERAQRLLDSEREQVVLKIHELQLALVNLR